MAAKKWLDPLDKMAIANSKATVENYLEIDDDEPVVSIDLQKIVRWKHKDRPENELGDIDELAETFKTVGQQQPCILRKSKDELGKYELLVGERRWRAAEKAGLRLKGIIKNIDDKTATLIQAIENDKRKDISDFAKGMSYADKIAKNLVTQKELIDILHVNKQQISRLLSYSNIPETLFLAIGDFRKVSSRTASELVRLSKRSDAHLNILIEMADKIRSGAYGQKIIERELEKKLNAEDNLAVNNNKILDDNGKHLFTLNFDKNALSIDFPKEITNLITIEDMQFNKIKNDIKEYVIEKIKEFESPRGD